MTEEDIDNETHRMDDPNFPRTTIDLSDSDSSIEDIPKQMATKSPSIKINKNTMVVKAPSHKLDIEERKKPKFK